MALVLGAQGAYTDVTGIINATAAAELVVEIDKMEALWNPGNGNQSASPDFDQMHKSLIEKVSTELAALKAAIAAAPTV